MRLSKTLVDMDMADYSAALDPAYTTLEFENVQVLAMGNGRCGHVCPVCQGWMAEEWACAIPLGLGHREDDGTSGLWADLKLPGEADMASPGASGILGEGGSEVPAPSDLCPLKLLLLSTSWGQKP